MYNENTVKINLNFITNGVTCAELLQMIQGSSSVSLLSRFGLGNDIEKVASDSFLSDLGLEQTSILANNEDVGKLLRKSDFIGTSVLSKSIETGLILLKNTNKNIHPLPFLGEKVVSKGKKERVSKDSYRSLKKNFTKDKSLQDNKYESFEYDMNKNKKFWYNVKTESLKRKQDYNDKLPDITWDIMDMSLKRIKNISFNIKKFNKLLSKIIANIMKKGIEDEVNLTIVTNIEFIQDYMKMYAKSGLKAKKYNNLKHCGVVRLTYEYNPFKKTMLFDECDIVYPTSNNHFGLIFQDSEYYYIFKGQRIPLQMKNITKDLLVKDIIQRCPNLKKYEKLKKK